MIQALCKPTSFVCEACAELPDGYDNGDFTWHNKEDGTTMELVDHDLHAVNKRTGGMSLYDGQHSDGF